MSPVSLIKSNIRNYDDHNPELGRQGARVDQRAAGPNKIFFETANITRSPKDLNAPGWRMHELKGDLRGYHSITVNGNWRVVLRFIGLDVELVDYLDYH